MKKGECACYGLKEVTDESESVTFKSTQYLIQTFVRTVKIDKLFLARFSSPLQSMMEIPNENEKQFSCEKIH
jgi:hypothetical protein